LSIRGVDISNTGDEDDEWKALDVVTVEVDVENNGNDDVSKVMVEIGLFDSAGRNRINDLDFTNADEEKIDLGRIRDGDRETVTFEFKVPADVDFDSYKLAVKAYSDDLKEQNECADSSSDLDNNFYQSIDIIEENDEGKFIAFDNIKLSSDRAVCGDSVTLTFDVFNIGDEDQDQVRVNVFNRALKIDSSQEIKSGLDTGDDKQLTFTFTVPQGLTDGIYVIEVTSEYDYRSGVYRQDSDDIFPVILTLIGCQPSASSGRIASITASLASEARAGEQLVVRSSITNLGNSAVTFAVNARGYDSWASLDSVSQRTVLLEAGQTTDVTFTFDVDESASGQKSFFIDASSGSQVESREVSVLIEKNVSRFSDLIGNNALIWIIAIIVFLEIALLAMLNILKVVKDMDFLSCNQQCVKYIIVIQMVIVILFYYRQIRFSNTGKE